MRSSVVLVPVTMLFYSLSLSNQSDGVGGGEC